VLADRNQANVILDLFKEAGEEGLTKEEISRKLNEKKCVGCDCENWIKTFLETHVIGKFRKNGEIRYRLRKK
jgi:hypothetical protein